MAGGFLARTICGMNATNSQMNASICYSPDKNAMVYRKNSTFIYSYDEWAISIVRDFQEQGYPRAAKNFAYAVDDANQMIKLFSIDQSTGKSIVFDGAKNIYTDYDLNYVVVKYNSGVVRAFYVDASANTYEFSVVLPAMEDEIENFYLLGDYFVFKLKNKKFYRIKLDKNKVSISPVVKGKKTSVEFTADTTPGQDGGPLNYSAKLHLSATGEGGDEV